MPCYGAELTGAEKAALEAKRKKALDKLEADLLRGKAKLVVKDGKTVFDGWPEEERVGMCDTCTIRRLTAAGSSALRMAQSRTQAVPDRMGRTQVR